MMTSMSSRGAIALKWMLKPCAKSTVEPGLSAGPIVDSHSSNATWSGTRMPMTSASATASATDFGAQPSSSARFQPSEFGRMPTVTSKPESLRLRACAWPCEP